MRTIEIQSAVHWFKTFSKRETLPTLSLFSLPHTHSPPHIHCQRECKALTTDFRKKAPFSNCSSRLQEFELLWKNKTYSWGEQVDELQAANIAPLTTMVRSLTLRSRRLLLPQGLRFLQSWSTASQRWFFSTLFAIEFGIEWGKVIVQLVASYKVI